MSNNTFTAIPKNDMLDFWIENNLNVLFVGRHGVGKTSMIIDAFKRNKKHYRYFSASTMDPFVDFIGVPKEMKDAKGSYLDLVRPKEFRDDEVEILFFDEFNRSHKKIRNAVMELVQFKTINGRPFPNLKMVWAAINPEDDEAASYDVEPLDPAQRDRFQVQIEIPYKPQIAFFRDKFGAEAADAAVEWWNKLPDDAKLRISPRRLDTALEMNKISGNIRHVLPPIANVEKLINALAYGSPLKNLREVMKKKDVVELKKWLANENNYTGVEENLSDTEFLTDCIPLLEEERLSKLVQSNAKIEKHVMGNPSSFKSTLDIIARAGQNVKIQKKALAAIASLVTAAPAASGGASAPIRILRTITASPSVKIKANNFASSYKYVSGVSYTHSAAVIGGPIPGYTPMPGHLDALLKSASKRSVPLSTKTAIMDDLIAYHRAATPPASDYLKVLELYEWYISKSNRGTIAFLNVPTLYILMTQLTNMKNSEGISDADFTRVIVSRYPNIAGKVLLPLTPSWSSALGTPMFTKI